jgi:tRNA(fMet)-specific endonuclease VapC
MSARNMGKNDLWIAATAHVLEATLITTDADFVHLKDIYMGIVHIQS